MKKKERPTRGGIFANSWRELRQAAFPQLHKYFKDCIKRLPIMNVTSTID